MILLFCESLGLLYNICNTTTTNNNDDDVFLHVLRHNAVYRPKTEDKPQLSDGDLRTCPAVLWAASSGEHLPQ